MKNIKWLAIALFGVLVFTIPVNLKATFPVVSASFVPLADVLNNLKASEFVKLSLKDISSITGKKLSLKEKISYTVMNKRMKHAIKKNPNLTVKDYLADEKKLSTGWVILIVILVLAISIGVIALMSFS